MSEPVDHGAAILAWLASAERYLILEGDSAKVAPSIPDASIDAIVADPPAGIAFMGKAWDGDKGGEAEWIAWLAGILAENLRGVLYVLDEPSQGLHPREIGLLIDALRRLPGVGQKSAQRMAFHLLERDRDGAAM